MLTSELPGLQLTARFVVPIALSLAGIIFFLGRLAVKAQRIKPTTGVEGLIGERGRTLTSVGPDGLGQVSVHGEIWRATSRVSIPPGSEIRVSALNGLTLIVEPQPRVGDST